MPVRLCMYHYSIHPVVRSMLRCRDIHSVDTWLCSPPPPRSHVHAFLSPRSRFDCGSFPCTVFRTCKSRSNTHRLHRCMSLYMGSPYDNTPGSDAQTPQPSVRRLISDALSRNHFCVLLSPSLRGVARLSALVSAWPLPTSAGLACSSVHSAF